MEILKVEGLIKIYGKRKVVDGVSFHVDEGEIVGLLGPNGAGKTTSFRMACGLIPTNGGIVYLNGKDVTHWAMYKRAKDGGMGYLPQDKSVFQRLTVEDNLFGVMEMLGMKRTDRKSRCDELLEKFRLTHLRHNYGGGLSGGERRRLEIARSLVTKPKILLLDEPFAAIDPVTVTSIQEIIRQLSAEKIAVLITDHSVQDTLEITQRSYVVQSGKVLCHGTPQEVLANSEARKVYFGDKISREEPHHIRLHREKDEKPHHHERKEHRSIETETLPQIPLPEKQEPIQPFRLKVSDSEKPNVQREIQPEHSAEVPVSPPDALKVKRLKRSFQTITLPEVPVKPSESTLDNSNAEKENDATLSTIIRNLGQVIGFGNKQR